MQESKEVINYAHSRAAMLTNIVYILADGIDTMFVDIISELDKLQLTVRHEEKMKVKKLLKSANDFKKVAENLAKPIYEINESESAVMDSDKLIDLVELMIDRMGENKTKIIQMRSTIFNFKSELNLYDKKNRY